MGQLTIHDILGTAEGLRKFGQGLRDAATTRVHDIPDVGTGVLVDPVVLAEISVWMFEAADELHSLIPDGPLVAFEDKRRTRTLVRVVGTNPKPGLVNAVLPGWNPNEVLALELPPEVYEALGDSTGDAPQRLYAWVNLGAPSADRLEFSDWEMV